MSDFVDSRTILKVYSGSISYGTNTPDSDEDYRGICIPTAPYLLGLDTFEQRERREPYDEVIFSLKKFVRLALENNPNIIDVLFTNEKHVIYINEFGQELVNMKNDFLSKRIFKTYGGYAVAQLKKMTSVEKNAIGKRAKTIEKYGYDTKNAMHLIRLLRMGIEILSGEGVQVYRPDRVFLNKIRGGEFTLDEIRKQYSELDSALSLSIEKSILPDEPNFEKINNWLIDVQKRSLVWNGNN